MKKSLLLAGMLALGMSAMAQNPYAYNAATGDMAIDGTEIPVLYTLNAAAERVVIDFLDTNGEVAKSVELTESDVTAGSHTVDVSLEGLEAGADYTLAIRVKGSALTAPVQCDPVYTFWSPYGIAVDNDPMSEHFGRILVTECQPSVNTAGASYWTGKSNEGVGVGIYVFDPQMQRVANPEGKYGFVGDPNLQENYGYGDYTGGTGNNFALKKVKISKDGRIFVGGLDVKNGQPLYEVNPDNLAEWTPIFVGSKSKYEETGYDCNLYDENGDFVAGYSACFAVTGEGDNLKIMNHSSTRGQVFAYGSYKMFEYPLGSATTWSTAVDEMNEVIPLSGQYTISAQSVSIDYDQNGNLWWTQYRGAPNESQPTLKHASKNADGEWEVDYSFITDDNFVFNRGGGIAVSPDGSKIALSTGNFKLTVADVTYNEFGAPELDLANAVTVTSTDVRGFNDIAWDFAGNLYGCDNGMETFRCFAFPRTAAAAPAGMKRAEADPNEAITPLRPEFTVSVPSGPVGVADLNANKAVTSVEYVNMNGQVSNAPFEGVNVVVTKYADGSKTVTKVVK